MSDFTELAAAVERKREGKTELWPQNDDAVIVRDVPLLIDRAERAEAERVEAEKLIGQMAEAFARLPEVEAERDRLAKALSEVEARSERLSAWVPAEWSSGAWEIGQVARDALAGEEQT